MKYTLIILLALQSCNIVWQTKSQETEPIGAYHNQCYTAEQIDSICWAAIMRWEAAKIQKIYNMPYIIETPIMHDEKLRFTNNTP